MDFTPIIARLWGMPIWFIPAALLIGLLKSPWAKGHIGELLVRLVGHGSLRVASAFPKGNPLPFQRTIRRYELRLVVPLAESTIYEMELRGEFPQRVNLPPRWVV